jgi:hypothetical protein
MYGAEEVIIYLKVSAECGGNWVGEGYCGKTVEVYVSIILPPFWRGVGVFSEKCHKGAEIGYMCFWGHIVGDFITDAIWAQGLSCAKLLNGLVEYISCNHIRLCCSEVSAWRDFEMVGGGVSFLGGSGECVWNDFSRL